MSRTRSNRHPVARSAWRPAAGSPTGEVEAVEATQRRPSAYMTLAEDPLGQFVAADWIGKFFMLGRLAARWSRAHADIQLVVVLSVPVRDFAAVLVGCGWMTATAEPSLPPVREVLAGLPLHAPVRVVTRSKVLAEHFGGVDVAKDRARFGTDWQIDKLRAVVPLESLDTPRSQPIPEPGVISRLTGIDKDWSARLCSPPQDLALVGMLKWLDEDLMRTRSGPRRWPSPSSATSPRTARSRSPLPAPTTTACRLNGLAFDAPVPGGYAGPSS